MKVVVGTKGCHRIAVDDDRNYWREPYTLTLTYDPEHGMRESVPLPNCGALFRISGPSGDWIDRATVRFDKPSLQRLQGDAAGRALLI